MKRTLGFIAVLASAFLLIGVSGASAAGKTVTISGKAFVFNHMDTYISGATIKVREFPEISTVTDSLGDYVLTVPDDANVTPYILSGQGTLTKHAKADDSVTGTVDTHWNEIDLQTFHTRGEDIVNANFQTPQDAEYMGLKVLLNVEATEDGRPAQCAIVTTASARNVRGTDYRGYWENTPHGVPGATSTETPSLDGPIYFDAHVYPDPTEVATSEDGGIIWSAVPAGTYRIVTTSPTTRFASFLATCAPGRVINANPPWGAYELTGDEQPLGASNVAASLKSVKAKKTGKRSRIVEVKVDTAEQVGVVVNIKRAGKLIGSRKVKSMASPRTMTFQIKPSVKPGKVSASVKLTDASGVSFTSKKTTNLPKVAKKKSKKRG